MTADGPLPALQQQLLDDTMLDALLADLSALTRILEVRGKSAARGHVSPEDLSLEEAAKQLREGQLRGVQVRYQYRDQTWFDTLLRTPEGIRLTRMCLPAEASADYIY